MAIRTLNEHGIPCAVLTNQTGVAHGRFTVEELHECFHRLIVEIAEAGARIDAIYYCPHAAPAEVKEFERDCEFHKPKPGMLLRAADDFGVGIQDCSMIGDAGHSDMVAGSSAGCTTILVRTGWGETSLTEFRDSWADVEPDRIEADLLSAARRLTESIPRQTQFRPADQTRIVEL